MMHCKYLITAVVSFVSVLSFSATITINLDSSASPESDLRTAIANAAAGDTIEITSSAVNPKITLTSVKSFGGDASLAIDKNLTIVGPDDGVTIDGGWNGTLLDNNTGTRIVKITGSSTAVAFRNIKFINGNGTYYDNTVRYLQGGAIYAEGPVNLENCTFRNNVSANFTGNGVYDTSIINGGGAIYAMNGLTIRDCVFENNSTARKNHDYNIWGGAVTMLGGALSVSGSKFSGNSCGSYKAGGSFYLGANVTSASFESSTFTGEHAGIWSDGAEGGGAIASVMTSGSFVIDGCAFTNCYVHSSCKGGAIRCDGSVAPIVRNSSFVGCSGGEGGAVYCSVANALFVSCLFQDNTVKSRGGAIRTEYGTAATLVNCSLVGNICLRTADGWNSPGAYHAPYLRLLNTVIAYNYLNVAGSPGVRDGEGGFSGAVASLWAYNTDYTDSTVMFANTKSVTTAVGQPTVTDNVPSIGETTLEGTISVPEANAIDPNGVLVAGGYPVKMTANGSYIGYSTDGGVNWTTFVGDASYAGDAVLVTNDIRGVNYEAGKTPIGAVCCAAGPGPTPEPVPPTIGSVNCSVSESTATITLAGIEKGTDTNQVAATDYDAYLTYALEGGAAQQAVLADQTGASCVFTLNALAAGNYTYSVVLTNSADIGSAVSNGVFTIKAVARPIIEQAKELKTGEWLAAPLAGNSGDIAALGKPVTYTLGNVVYTNAYAGGAKYMSEAGHASIGGMVFNNEGYKNLLSGGTTWGAVTDNDCTYFGVCGKTGDYARLMGAGYFGGGRGDVVFTVGQYPYLEVGKKYMLQLFFHSDRSNMYQGQITAVGTGKTVQYGALNAGDDWYYGGTLVHVFEATDITYSFTLNYSGADAMYNAFLLRMIPNQVSGFAIIVR